MIIRILFVWFQIISLVFIAIGIWAYVLTKDINQNISEEKDIFDYFFDFSLIFIVFGILIFFLSFLGAIGALRENICLLKSVSISFCTICILNFIK